MTIPEGVRVRLETEAHVLKDVKDDNSDQI